LTHSEVDANQRLYDRLLDGMKEASVAASQKPDAIGVLSNSGVPKSAFHPVVSRYFFLALGIGIPGGLVVAVFFAAFDPQISPRRNKLR
jgi:uncharacterized protein involved in exopolysaccharide biosynthesis